VLNTEAYWSVVGVQSNGISSSQVRAAGKFVIHVKKMFKVARKMISLLVLRMLLMRHVGNTNRSQNFDMKYEWDLKRILHIASLSSIGPKADSITENLEAFQNSVETCCTIP
jgi:hypothetical protein